MNTVIVRACLLLVATLAALACSTTPRPKTPQPDNSAVPQEYLAIPRAGAANNIEIPKVQRRVEPDLPEELRRRPRPITASVEAVINASGSVEAVWYSRGDRELAAEFARALYRWQFEPATRDGVPIAVRYVLTTTIN